MNKFIKALTCASILFTIGDLYGKTTNWTGATDSNWNTSTNWSNGLPQDGDTVNITMATNNPISLDTTRNLSLFNIGTGCTIELQNNAILKTSQITTGTGSISLDTGTTFAINPTNLSYNSCALTIQGPSGPPYAAFSTNGPSALILQKGGTAKGVDISIGQAGVTTDEAALQFRPTSSDPGDGLGSGIIRIYMDGELKVSSENSSAPDYTLNNPVEIYSNYGSSNIATCHATIFKQPITVGAGSSFVIRSLSECYDSYVKLQNTINGMGPGSTYDIFLRNGVGLQIENTGGISDVGSFFITGDVGSQDRFRCFAHNVILSTVQTQFNGSVLLNNTISVQIASLWGENGGAKVDLGTQDDQYNSTHLTIIGPSTGYFTPTTFPGYFVGIYPITLNGYSTKLSGDNSSFAGGFHLNSGAHLGIDGVNALGGPVNMDDRSYLDFFTSANSDSNFELNGICTFDVSNSYNTQLLTGELTTATTATVNKIGTGTLTINEPVTVGSNINFDIIQGTLNLNTDVPGSVTSVTVEPGATLSGTGTYGGQVTVQPGSTFIVGSSSPTGGVVHLQLGAVLDIAGELLLSAPANGSFSVIQGAGDVNLAPGSSLNVVIPRTFFQFGTPIPLIALSRGSISGSFSEITTGPFGLLNIKNFQSIPGQLMMAINPITVQQFKQKFKSSFNSKNALKVGSSLIQNIKPKMNQYQAPTMGFAARAGNGSVENTSLGNLNYEIFLELLYLPNINALNDALNQMQPALYKGMVVVQENNAVKIQNTLSYRFEQELNEVFCHRFKKESQEQAADSCKKDEKNFHVWAAGFGDSLHQKSTYFAGSTQTGYNSNTGGITIGVDQCFAQYFYVGALGGYTASSVNWTSDQGHADVETGYAGLYLSGISDMFYGNVSLIGGWSSYDGHRNIEYGTVDETAKTRHGGSQILTHADTGINLGWKGFTIRPFDAFDYIAQTENGFTEHGAGVYNLKVKKSNPIMVRNELGLEFAGCVCFGNSKLTISPKISWVREVRTKGKSYKAKIVDTDTYASYTGYFPDRSLASPGVLISGLMWKDRLALDLYYNGEFADKYADHNYGGEIRFGF